GRFWAKVKVVPTNQLGPSCGSGGATRVRPMRTRSQAIAGSGGPARIPEKRRTSDQNSSGFLIDQSGSVWKSTIDSAPSPRARTCAMKRVRLARSISAGDGVHSGASREPDMADKLSPGEWRAYGIVESLTSKMSVEFGGMLGMSFRLP